MSVKRRIQSRREWFQQYIKRIEDGVVLPEQDCGCYTCPCCGYPTLGERGAFEICEICGWEDDGQDDPTADEVWGGPNADYSLTEARGNFEAHMTMYRKTDTEKFERETSLARLQQKRMLIQGYGAQQA